SGLRRERVPLPAHPGRRAARRRAGLGHRHLPAPVVRPQPARHPRPADRPGRIPPRQKPEGPALTRAALIGVVSPARMSGERTNKAARDSRDGCHCRLPIIGQGGIVMTITDQPSRHAVEASIGIAARPEKVFGYVTDVRREPEWNPQLREAEKLTPGPIGAGTRYRVRFGRGVGTAMIENTAFDPPRNWAAVSTSRRLRVRFWGQVTEAAG